jgi:hypothetical protein
VQLYAVAVPAILAIAVFAISLTGMKYAATTDEQDESLPPTSAPAPLAAPSSAPLAAAPTSDVSRSSSQVPQPAETATPDPVRFRNPFDPSEVFDFPPGTTRDEARAAVAALLIERARNRSR